MPRDSIQPFSRKAWEERRRRWALEQERKRRNRIRALGAFAALALAFVLVWIYYVTPSDWKEQAGRFAEKVTDVAGRLADR